MTPDLNQIRRDLGLLDDQETQGTSMPRQESFQPPPLPRQEGVTLNSIGWWLLAICITGLLVWIFIDPIIALLMLLVKVVIWGVVICIGLVILGSLAD